MGEHGSEHLLTDPAVGAEGVLRAGVEAREAGDGPAGRGAGDVQRVGQAGGGVDAAAVLAGGELDEDDAEHHGEEQDDREGHEDLQGDPRDHLEHDVDVGHAPLEDAEGLDDPQAPEGGEARAALE